MTSKDNAKSASIAWGKDFYRLTRWRTVRSKALKLYGSACHCCGNPNTKKPPEVDHIKPRSKYPELSFAMTNLQVLCEKCNSTKGNRHETDYRPTNHIKYANMYASNPSVLKSIHRERLLVERVGTEEAKRRQQQTKENKKQNPPKRKPSRATKNKEKRFQVKFVAEMREANLNNTLPEVFQKYKDARGEEYITQLVKRCNMGHWVSLIS